MARILFAWELGANFGHLAHTLPLAERLRAMGHHVAFAVRDTTTAARVLFPRGFGFVQAPFSNDAKGVPRPPASYAEMLLAEGFGHTHALLGRMRAWLMLFDLCRPDVVVADHAPTALAAAAVAVLPAVPIGSGFSIPPPCSPFPSIRPWEFVDDARLVRAEDEVLESLGRVARTLGGQPLANLADLFVDPVLATFRELDHYAERKEGRYFGSLHGLSAGVQAAWPERTTFNVLAYLRPSMPGFTAVLEALSAIDGHAITVAPGISRQDAGSYASSVHTIFYEPVCLDDLLGDANLVVGYGGAGIIAQTLLSGVPLLLLPENVEQWLGARRVVSLGAGRMIGKARSADVVRAALKDSLLDTRLQLAAREFAREYADHDVSKVVGAVSAAILDRVGGQTRGVADLKRGIHEVV